MIPKTTNNFREFPGFASIFLESQKSVALPLVQYSNNLSWFDTLLVACLSVEAFDSHSRPYHGSPADRQIILWAEVNSTAKKLQLYFGLFIIYQPMVKRTTSNTLRAIFPKARFAFGQHQEWAHCTLSKKRLLARVRLIGADQKKSGLWGRDCLERSVGPLHWE